MKQKPGWLFTLALVLLAMTGLVYYIHYLIFRDVHHILLYFVGDIAFVFFEVLLVTLIIHRLLHHREQRAVQDKIHMLVGAFFSELGTELLRRLAFADDGVHGVSADLASPHDWSEAEFLDVRERAVRHDAGIDPQRFDYASLYVYLQPNRPFLLDLLQNQSLIQDEPFTNLIWAVFHLLKELEHRGTLTGLAPTDREHLGEDVHRVYELLMVQWMDYMHHLKADYPYLFSLAARTNPFHRAASVEVR